MHVHEGGTIERDNSEPVMSRHILQHGMFETRCKMFEFEMLILVMFAALSKLYLNASGINIQCVISTEQLIPKLMIRAFFLQRDLP